MPPFVLPDRWLWVSLEDFVFAVTDGDHQPPPQSVSGIPFLVISDVNTGHISFDKARYTDEDYYKGLPEIRKAAKGDILFTVTGSYGIVIPVETERRFCFQRHIGLIKTITSSSWLAMVLQSDYVQSYCDKVATGTAQKTVSLGHLRDLLIPIPPKEEQGRITKELQKWLGEVKNIATESDSLLSIISKTKSRILDLAIHGKLVSQDPNDEPAIELLKRINPKFTPCDNAHYGNMPVGWQFIELGKVCQLTEGKPKDNGELPYLDVKAMRTGHLAHKSSGKYVEAGTMLILVDGENSGEVFKTETAGYQGSTMKVLNIDKNMNEEYVLQFIRLFKKALKENKVGSAIPHLNKKMFRELVIPIPPRNEQARIVSVIQQYEIILDGISANL